MLRVVRLKVAEWALQVQVRLRRVSSWVRIQLVVLHVVEFYLWQLGPPPRLEAIGDVEFGEPHAWHRTQHLVGQAPVHDHRAVDQIDGRGRVLKLENEWKTNDS